MVTTRAYLSAIFTSESATGRTHRGIDDGNRDALLVEPLGNLECQGCKRAHRDEEHVAALTLAGP